MFFKEKKNTHVYSLLMPDMSLCHARIFLLSFQLEKHQKPRHKPTSPPPKHRIVLITIYRYKNLLYPSGPESYRRVLY